VAETRPAVCHYIGFYNIAETKGDVLENNGAYQTDKADNKMGEGRMAIRG
jgi:hypothetical protein